MSAQNGMHSGASVSAVTKSGTNALHGNAFEFVRDSQFNATSSFPRSADGSRKDDGLKRNQSAARSVVRSSATGCSSLVDIRARISGRCRPITAGTDCRRCRRRLQRVGLAGLQRWAAIVLRAPFVNNRIDPAGLQSRRGEPREAAAASRRRSVRRHHL